jgi:hypothetical protein
MFLAAAMQADKLKGVIDSNGHLIVANSVSLPLGEVEIIVLQPQYLSLSQPNRSKNLASIETPFSKTY